MLLLAALVVAGTLGGAFSLLRGHNSSPIAARGGEAFHNFATLRTPFYLQHDPRWKDEPIGGSGETLGKVGCAVCSLAMALDRFGVSVTPAELNGALKANQGYTWRGWLKWDTISKISDHKVLVQIVSKPTHSHLDTALKRGHPVLAKVFLHHVVPHWVLVVGKEGAEYLIRDPLGDGYTVERLSKYHSDIFGIRIVQPAVLSNLRSSPVLSSLST